MKGERDYSTIPDWHEPFQGPPISEPAMRDAMKHIARDVPDPRRFARYMPSELAEALMAAGRDSHGNSKGCFYATGPMLPELRAYGLVEAAGSHPKPKGYLSVFGMRVRRALMEGDA